MAGLFHVRADGRVRNLETSDVAEGETTVPVVSIGLVEVDTTEVSLAWEPSNATTWTLTWGLAGTGSAIDEPVVVPLPGVATSYNLLGLGPDTAYRWSLSGTNAAGTSAVSVQDFRTAAVIPVPVGQVVTLTPGDAAASANLAALRAAAGAYDAITVRGGRCVISDEWVVAHRCTAVTFEVGTGLEVLKDNTPVLGRVGTADDYISAAGVAQGGTTFTAAAGAFPVGSHVVVMSRDPVKANSKSTRGYLRTVIAANGGTYTVDRAWPRPMSTQVVASRHRLAPGLTVVGGRFSQRRPENDFFTALVDLRAARDIVFRGSELTAGGSNGFYVYNCLNVLIEDPFIHDLLDDDVFAQSGVVQTQGAVRENGTKLPARKGISQAEGHYGYGVNAVNATRNLTVRGGKVRWVRHAFTTGGASGNLRINAQFSPSSTAGRPDYMGAGECETLDWSTDVDACTSCNLSPHEQGVDLWFHDFTSSDSGRYRHDYPTRTNDQQENPDHANVRNLSTTIERVTMTGNCPESNGVTLQDALAGVLPTVTVRDCLITGVGKGFGNRGHLVLDGVTLRGLTGSRVGVHQQGGTVTGGDVVVDSAGTAFLVAAGTVVLAPVRYVNVGTKVSGPASITEGAATGGSGNV